MNATKLVLSAVVVSMVASSAVADIWNTGDTRYSWLMNRNVSSSWGTDDGPTAAYPGYGSVGGIQAALSNGMRVWIPGGNVTGNGASTYWAQVDLGETRPIDYLRLCTYHESGMSFTKLLVQFSNDADFSTYQEQVLYNDPNSSISSDWLYDRALGNLYNARYVRVVFPENCYTGQETGYSGNRGGPGLWAIEPCSPLNTDIVVDGNFNLALNAFTGTEQQSNGFRHGNGSMLGDGILLSLDGYRAGAAKEDWDGGANLIVELNDVYLMDAVRITWNFGQWISNGLTLEFSKDGKAWDKIEPVVVTDRDILCPNVHGTDAAYITFDPREAQFIRWTNVAPDPDNPGELIAQPAHTIAHEFMVYGQAVPEPATMTLLALGGLAILRWKNPKS